MSEKKRRQVSFWGDPEFFEAVERIRHHTSPIPTASDAIRQAVIDKAKALVTAAERKRASTR